MRIKTVWSAASDKYSGCNDIILQLFVVISHLFSWLACLLHEIVSFMLLRAVNFIVFCYANMLWRT